MEEARFILRTLQREDLFGARVRLTEAERVLDSSISLSFADYCGFLNKYGYVRIDQLANLIEVTEGGALVSQDMDDAEFHARLSRHFARELEGAAPVPSAVPRALPRQEPAPVETTAPRTPRPAVTLHTERPAGGSDEVLDRRYRRGEVIGAGPMATVYRGQHVSLGRKMALKEARSIFQFASYLRRDEIVRRLRTTIETHASLLHPNIIQILDQNPEREYPYFVMELALGGNLRQRMKAQEAGRLELPVAIRVLLQICYALKYAHAENVLHLGIKPENVLFDHLGNVKLSDFGFSRVTERGGDGENTPVLVGGGSVGYMAPERLQPEQQRDVEPEALLSGAADIYSLGVLFYEMITGRLPGRRSPLPSQARKDVPSAFDDVFDKMTRDELTERYRSIDEVLEGIYKAFPSKEVFSIGTVLLWSEDPNPLPEPEPEPTPEPEPEVSQAPEPEPEAPEEVLSSEQQTGEIEIPEPESLRPSASAIPPRRKRPPPPPRK